MTLLKKNIISRVGSKASCGNQLLHTYACELLSNSVLDLLLFIILHMVGYLVVLRIHGTHISVVFGVHGDTSG